VNTLKVLAASLCAIALAISTSADGASRRAQPRTDDDQQLTNRIAPLAEEAIEDSRFVDYEFNPNQVFDISVSTHAHLHILLADGEEARHFSVYDKNGWTWTADVDTKRSIYVRAKPGARPTSATLRTTHGIYEMTFRAVNKGVVYRQVRFHHPSIVQEAENNAKLAQERTRLAIETRQSAEIPVARPPEQLNFKYNAEGSASFKPTSVFDDGEQTYVVLAQSSDMPALFETDAEGKAKSVAYTQRNGTLIVRRVMSRFVLALGSEKITVTSAGYDGGKAWRWPWQ